MSRAVLREGSSLTATGACSLAGAHTLEIKSVAGDGSPEHAPRGDKPPVANEISSINKGTPAASSNQPSNDCFSCRLADCGSGTHRLLCGQDSVLTLGPQVKYSYN